MPKVIPMNLKRLKPLITLKDPDLPATMKQKNYIIILCERRKIPVPHPVDLKYMKMSAAT